MTEKAGKIYNDLESHFQDGDGSLEVDMLFNLSDMLSNTSDDFLNLFTWEYNNELQDEDEYEDDDEYDDDPGLMYEDPKVIFRLKKNPDILIIVDCSGFMCLSQPSELAEGVCSSYCIDDDACFRCEVNADNNVVAQRMLEYFTLHFLDKDIKLPNN